MAVDSYRCRAARGPLHASVSVPGSKSLTNRALLLAAVADGETVMENALFADDTVIMMDCLGQLGVTLHRDAARARIRVEGSGGAFPATESNLYCGNSGTSIRFLGAMLAAGVGRFELDGKPRMRERPIGALMDVLNSQGAGVEYGGQVGYPPVILHANRLSGGHIGFRDPPSSQMVSALLMASPLGLSDMMIQIVGRLISRPYVDMTLSVMERFGVSAVSQFGDDARFIVPPQRYSGTTYDVEPDASNATYFLAAAAIAGGSVTIPGLGRNSVQGDVGFLRVLESMGCDSIVASDSVTVTRGESTPLTAVDVDLSDMPDTAQTLSVIAMFARGKTELRGLASLRVKETDRLSALEAELRKLGASVETGSSWIRITPPSTWRAAQIETYDDHRMAMSFALAGLHGAEVEIKDPTCCAKTFPDYFPTLDSLLDSA